jgi:hypothetical protein
MKNTTQPNFETTLQEIQQKIVLLKDKKQEASKLKTELEKKIDDLYAKPLNERQRMQFMLAGVDERAALYKKDVRDSGFFESQKM